MADLDIADLIRGLYEQSSKTRRNPARHPADTTGRVDEIPIALISQGVMAPLENPLWGEYIYTDELTDNFETTQNERVALEEHVADTGHAWTKGRGQLAIDTGDWVGFGGLSPGERYAGFAYMSARATMIWAGVAELVATAKVGAIFSFARFDEGVSTMGAASVIHAEINKIEPEGIRQTGGKAFPLFEDEVNRG